MPQKQAQTKLSVPDAKDSHFLGSKRMQHVIVAIGRWKAAPEKALYEKFKTRIRPTLQLREVEEKKPIKGRELLRREAQLLLNAVPNHARVVVLDGNGERLSSLELASKLRAWRDNGAGTIAFLIGGAIGLNDDVRKRADLILSLGPQTWSHMLVRVMLAEQLYRVQSILMGHPYHRE